jgi:hypothetical protein
MYICRYTRITILYYSIRTVWTQKFLLAFHCSIRLVSLCHAVTIVLLFNDLHSPAIILYASLLEVPGSNLRPEAFYNVIFVKTDFPARVFQFIILSFALAFDDTEDLRASSPHYIHRASCAHHLHVQHILCTDSRIITAPAPFDVHQHHLQRAPCKHSSTTFIGSQFVYFSWRNGLDY